MAALAILAGINVQAATHGDASYVEEPIAAESEARVRVVRPAIIRIAEEAGRDGEPGEANRQRIRDDNGTVWIEFS